jgi:reverse gyrase
LGKYITHYRANYFTQSGYMGYDWTPNSYAMEKVVEKIKPLILQLSAEDYLAMPELIEKYIPIDLPTKAMQVYREVENYFLSELESGTVVAGSAAAAGVKCRQVANGAVYSEDRTVIPIHEEKLNALEDLIEELGGAPALVLYEFIHDATRIRNRLGNTPILGSGLSDESASALIDRFNEGKLPVLLGHPASMGHGLNLQQSCRCVIWYGIPWNLEHYDQAIARVYRQGQKGKSVLVYHIVARGTLDETVVKTLTRKDKDQQSLLRALNEHRT